MRNAGLSLLMLLAVMATVASATDVVGNFPNPHWDRRGCLNCHTSIPKEGKGANLRFEGDFITICNSCHESVSRNKYIHAVAMMPPADQMDRMPDEFRRAVRKDREGRLTCVVCHELRYQCLSSEYYRKEQNPRFFRGGPYAKRTDLCYLCHDRSRYERLNPHDQITDEGDLNIEVCTYCHSEVPDRRKVKSIKDVGFVVDDDLNRLCTRCHNKGPDCSIHAETSDNHKVKRAKDVKVGAEKDRKDYIVPLEPATGKIFCGTCHNPHEIGVQRLSKADRGADSDKRLRMGILDRCTACHGKDYMPVAPIIPAKHPKIE